MLPLRRMKTLALRTFFVLFFSFVSNLCLGQDLILNDLRYLFTHGLEDIYISAKGFEYNAQMKDPNKFCDTVSWACGRNIANDRANAFVSKTCIEANDGFVNYQFAKRVCYDNIRMHCKTTGFKLIKSEMNQFNNLCSTYKKVHEEVEFCSGINSGTNRTSYTITYKVK